MAPPFRIVDFDIIYGRGISKEGELIDLGVKQELVDKAGAWYSYNGIRIGQGRENAKQYMRDNVETAKDLEEKIKFQLLNSDNNLVIGGADNDVDNDEMDK